MAKNEKPPKAGDTSWMSAFMSPSQAQFMRYMGAQQGQYNPLIKTLRGQLAATKNIGKDPTVKAYESLLKALPSSEAVSGAYRGGLGNVAQYLQGIDVARGGRGVSEAIGALGGALGVEGAGDIAQAAGTVSGVGAAGGDVFSKALMGAAAGKFAELETERLGQIGEQRQTLTLGAGEARKTAKAARQELARLLATTRGQRTAAALNPLDIATSIMAYKQNLQKLRGYGSGGSGTTTTPDTGDGDTVGATESEILSWMQSPTGGGFGVIGQGGLGSEGAARGQFRQQNRRNR